MKNNEKQNTRSCTVGVIAASGGMSAGVHSTTGFSRGIGVASNTKLESGAGDDPDTFSNSWSKDRFTAAARGTGGALVGVGLIKR